MTRDGWFGSNVARRWLVMLCGVVLAGCQVGGDAGRPTSPPPVGAERLSTIWTAPGPSDPSVMAADELGVVVVSAIGEVRAYYPAGQPRWTTSLLNMPVSWSPALGATTVVVSLGDRVVALDRGTGGVRWWVGLPDPGRLAIDAGSDGVETVVITGDSYVAAYRVDSGQPRWGVRFTPNGIVAASVVTSGGRAFVGVTSAPTGMLYAFDLASGESLWRAPIAAHAAEPALVGGEIVVAERLVDGSRIRGLDLATGRPTWTLPVTGTFLPGHQAAVDDHGYAVADDEGDVLLVDTASHSVRWTVRAGRHPANVSTTLLLRDRVLTTADGHGLVSIDRRTGRVLGRDPDREVLRSVVPVARALYALSGIGSAGILRRREA